MASEGLLDGINRILSTTFISLERNTRWPDECKTLGIDFVVPLLSVGHTD